MPCFGKSQTVIAHRRDVKRQATDHIIALARQFPRPADKGNSINEGALTIAAIDICQWWGTLSPEDRTVLRTAKGCKVKPAGAPPYGHNNETNFADFLANSLSDPYDIPCWAAWLRVALLWAHQIRTGNPHTFPPATTVNIAAEIKSASDAEFAAAMA